MLRNGPDEFNKAMRHSLTKSSKTPANDGIVVFKGLKNVALTREFSTFLVRDNLALNYLNWLSDAFISDEHFYSTLVRVTVNNVTREVSSLLEGFLYLRCNRSGSRVSGET